jgi:SAM-dependent methyltransferase
MHERRQRSLVVEALASPGALDTFASGDHELPSGFGVNANERIVEIPWLFAQHPQGRVLDAGSSLNHREYLDRILPVVEELHIVTLAFEGVAHPDRNISYVYADLRELPYRDGFFDTVLTVSTIEHVGMDNRGYGGGERAVEPEREAERAVAELRRVVRDGGRLLLTVPYGEKEDHGTFRQFDRKGMERLVEAARPRETHIAVFLSTASGWQLSDLDRAAGARYRTGFSAEAVACVELTC